MTEAVPQPSYRHPAEWEPHEATWLCWPHTRADWPGKLAAVRWGYGEIARRLAPGEKVRLLVNSALHERSVRTLLEAVGVPAEAVETHRVASDRSWTRDMGPIFLRTSAAPRPVVAHFGFNGWAKYENFQKDAAVPEKVARLLGLERVTPDHEGRAVVLEGGAVDTNGRGTLLATEECLLDPAVQVRNPGFGRADYEAVFARWLGASRVLWLGRGIAGDEDTHGHVDDMCRFVNPTTVVLALEGNRADANYAPLQENRERLEGMRVEDGSRVNVVPLPMPEPLAFRGRRLPASYANFYIGNTAVLVPTFNDPHDREALGILADLFPGRAVVGIHAVDLAWGLGAIHCLTHEQPA